MAGFADVLTIFRHAAPGAAAATADTAGLVFRRNHQSRRVKDNQLEIVTVVFSKQLDCDETIASVLSVTQVDGDALPIIGSWVNDAELCEQCGRRGIALGHAAQFDINIPDGTTPGKRQYEVLVQTSSTRTRRLSMCITLDVYQ